MDLSPEEAVCSEQKLKARETYMSPEQAQTKEAVLKKEMKANFSYKPLELNDGDGNNHSAIFQRIQKAPDVKLPRKLNDGEVNNYSAVFQRIQKDPVVHKPQRKFRRVKKLDLGGPGLYNNCDCRRRNGLQNDCRLTFCHGRPECLTDPPTCVHSQGTWYD
jgi:hypothetical protein